MSDPITRLFVQAGAIDEYGVMHASELWRVPLDELQRLTGTPAMLGQ